MQPILPKQTFNYNPSCIEPNCISQTPTWNPIINNKRFSKVFDNVIDVKDLVPEHIECHKLWRGILRPTYAQMIAIAIQTSKLKMVKLSDIYDFIEYQFHDIISYDQKGWKV